MKLCFEFYESAVSCRQYSSSNLCIIYEVLSEVLSSATKYLRKRIYIAEMERSRYWFLNECLLTSVIGSNFKSMQDIEPFLEPSGSGISSLWARTTALKYDCTVAVGYPETVDVASTRQTGPKYYNSTIVVNGDGQTIANYRKSFLYCTDETWASEGRGFYGSEIAGAAKTAIGICK